ncbi:sensor histidine kinase [Flavobacterium hauense]
MIFLNKPYLRLLIFLVISHISFGQENYHTEWFSADSKHLPQNSVKSITPDKYGYIWLSTENGVVRYDGQNFKTYNSENIKGLSSNRMLLFAGSIKKDSIIILNERSEILLINKRTVKSLDTVTHKKFFVVLSQDAYLINRNISSRKSKKIAFSVKDQTYTFSMDSMSLYNSNYKLSIQKKFPNNDSIQFFVSSGNLYTLNKRNEYSLFSEINQSYKKFGTGFTKKIKLYSNDIAQQTFLYSDDKLFFLKEVNGQIKAQLVFSNFNFQHNNIVSAYYDEINNILFLGSTNKGLLVVKPNDFSHNSTILHHSTGSDDVYYALTKFDNSNVLASTGEIFGTDGTTKLIDIGGYTDKYVVLLDKNGDVWTKKNNFLYRFSKKSNFKEHQQWEFENVINRLTKSSDGSIYIGIGLYNKVPNKGVLYIINPNEQSPSPKLLLNLDFPPSDILEINKNKLWCGTWEGLYEINLTTKKTQRVKSVGKSQVRNFYTPKTGETWICTYNNGFYLYRNGKITHMPKDRNGYLLTAHCILEDKQGFMWITTNQGLFVVKKQDLYNYADNTSKQVYYHAYNKSSGFLNNEFNGGCSPCGVNLNNETIFFPSMDGVVYFNPENAQKRQPSGDIFLDHAEADSIVYHDTQNLAFNRNFGKIKFFISSPFFGNPYNQNIESRLEGPVGQDWTPLTENNVSFSTLPPGEYKLQIRKLSGFGSKYIYKDYYFSVTPAFWQTGWFTALLIALGVLVIYISVKLRIRYIKHKNIQLEKQVVLRTQQLQSTVVTLRKTKEDLSVQVKNHKNLIKTITHDIKSPLKFIAITGKYLYNNLEKSGVIEKNDVKAIHTSSSQLYHFVDNFLEYAKETDLNNSESEPYSLHTLAHEKIAFFKNIATAAKTTLKNETDAHLFITVNRHLLSIILHNLLDNALKNTFGGTISIKSIKNDNSISISVTDTGKGMKPEMADYYSDLFKGKHEPKKQNGMGLHMIAELSVIIAGKLTITSIEDKSTTITISFTQNN